MRKLDPKGEVWIDSADAQVLVKSNKPNWYSVYVPKLEPKYFDGRRPFYRERDVLAIQDGSFKDKRRNDIIDIDENLIGNYIKPEYHQTIRNHGSVQIRYLPRDASEQFDIPERKEFYMQVRISSINDSPVYLCRSYYPADLLDNTIIGLMETNPQKNVREYLRDRHDLYDMRATDQYTARVATDEEREILHLDLVLEIKRISWTMNKETVISYEEIILNPAWFHPKFEYKVYGEPNIG